MATKVKVTGYKTMTENLTENYNLLCEGKLPLKTANEISRMAGRIIKLQLGKIEYTKMNTPGKIEWWEK